MCQHGAREVQQKVFEKIGNENLKMYVVWTPVVGGDSRKVAGQTVSLIADPRARHFWDGTGELGRAYGKAVSLPGKKTFAWDIYFVFDASVRWGQGVPTPASWMHQLGRGEGFLDANKLHDIVQKQLRLTY